MFEVGAANGNGLLSATDGGRHCRRKYVFVEERRHTDASWLSFNLHLPSVDMSCTFLPEVVHPEDGRKLAHEPDSVLLLRGELLGQVLGDKPVTHIFVQVLVTI